jgi:hypothetical protein
MPTTPVYGLPYQALTDIPHGAALGRNLADAVEDELVRIDAGTAARLQLAQMAVVSVLINPVANTVTSAAVVWGKTLSGTVYAVVTAETALPGSQFKEATIASVTTTGATVYIYRTNTSATTVRVLAVAGV